MLFTESCPSMTDRRANPYADLPKDRFWKRAVEETSPLDDLAPISPDTQAVAF